MEFQNWWPLALVVLFPAIGAVSNGLLGLVNQRRGKPNKEMVVSAIALGASFAAFLVATWGVLALVNAPADEAGYRVLSYEPYTWIVSELIKVPIKLVLDPLSAVMVLVVTGVGFLIHVYSVGYMHGEEGYYRYFAYLNLFMFSMLILVLGGNFLLLFVGWEGVGLCSYLLIGYYFTKDFAATAGKKAFVVNRVGDFGFLIGILFVATIFGTLDFDTVLKSVGEHQAALLTPLLGSWGPTVITVLTLSLFVGAMGKSAQIPLYVWLPDAMAGPTPVSALIHAATMVTAGVYMVVRCSPLFLLSPTSMAVVAWIGVLTSLMAALIAMTQTDIKKVLAYSTVSQLGYMFVACGVGAFGAAIFHLMTHAFFKACLFLGSGCVIHAMHHAYHHTGDGESDPQDMRNMGGLWARLPWTFLAFLLATMAIAGLPPLSGFFSKDEILWKAFMPGNEYGSFAIWLIGWVVAGMTAFYMFRLLAMTFLGTTRVKRETFHQVHELPWTMLAPVLVLAVLSVAGGWINIPQVLGSESTERLHHFLEPQFERYRLEMGASDHGVAELESAGGPVGLGEVSGDRSPRGAGHELLATVPAGGHGELEVKQELSLIWFSVAIGVMGMVLAGWLYLKAPEVLELIRSRLGRFYDVVVNKFYVDEFYEATFVDGTKKLGENLAKFDLARIDGLVNGVAKATVWTSKKSVRGDLNFIDSAVNGVGESIMRAGLVLRRIQMGSAQGYIVVMAAGLFALIVVFVLL